MSDVSDTDAPKDGYEEGDGETEPPFVNNTKWGRINFDTSMSSSAIFPRSQPWPTSRKKLREHKEEKEPVVRGFRVWRVCCLV